MKKNYIRGEIVKNSVTSRAELQSSNANRNDLIRPFYHFSFSSTSIPILLATPQRMYPECKSAFLAKNCKRCRTLEPLIPTCRSCLEHRHSYDRKNAVFALYSIYREFENLIPDAPELMHAFLITESDSACKRSAFVFLKPCR